MPKLSYIELPAKEPAVILDFFSKVLDWKTKPWGEKYWMIKSEEGETEGAIFLSEQMKSVLATFTVDNLEETIKKIEEFGGKIISEPHEAGEDGLHVYFKDPEGTIYGLFQEKK